MIGVCSCPSDDEFARKFNIDHNTKSSKSNSSHGAMVLCPKTNITWNPALYSAKILQVVSVSLPCVRGDNTDKEQKPYGQIYGIDVNVIKDSI